MGTHRSIEQKYKAKENTSRHNPKEKNKTKANNQQQPRMDLVTKHLTKSFMIDWVTFSSHCRATTVIEMMKPCQSFIKNKSTQRKKERKGEKKKQGGGKDQLDKVEREPFKN